MRIILVVILMLVTTSAWGQWYNVGTNSNLTYFIERDSIRKDGEYRRVWELLNYNEEQEGGVLSRRALKEYDCPKGRSRRLLMSSHSGLWAKNSETISEFKPRHPEWEYVKPNTTPSDILKLVCD